MATTSNRAKFRALVFCVLGCLTAGFYFNYPGGPSTEKQHFREVGSTLAKEAIKLLPAGGPIILISRDTETFQQPALEETVKGFLSVLKESNLAPTTTLSLQVDPLRPTEVPPGDFAELIRKNRKGGVIVSLMGPPLLDSEVWNRLGKFETKLVALCTGSLPQLINLPQLFSAGFLHVAVVDRTGLNRTNKVKFEHRFNVLRASEVSKL